jgi:hypothetical protein
MSNFKYDAKEIKELTMGGLDVILTLYPDADKKGGRWQKIQLTFENEQTPSTCIIPQSVDTDTVLIKSFSSGRSFNCFELVQSEHSLTFYESCEWIANTLGLKMSSGNSNFGKAGFEMIEALKDQKDGDYIFEYHNKLTNFELETLGKLVEQSHCDKFHLKSCKQFTQVKSYPNDLDEHKSTNTHKYAGKTMQIITKSTDTFPILVFDFKTWQKIYQPLNTDKSFRFRYAGDKPKKFVFGLDQLAKQFEHNKKNIQKKIAQAKKEEITLEDSELDPRINNLIIGSGDRDSINIFSMSFDVVWLNSETEKLDYKLKKRLFELAINVYYCGDIDATGIQETIDLAKTHIDVKIIWLPDFLKEKTYRNKPKKDVKDLVDEMFDKNEPKKVSNYFKKLVFNALPAEFWFLYTKKDGTKAYEVSNEAMLRFLYYNGFQRYKEELAKKDEYDFINYDKNIIHESDETTLKNFPIKWLNEKLFPIKLIDTMHRSAQLNKDKLMRLPLLTPNFDHFGKDFQYQFYKNKMWKILPDGIDQISYGKAEVDVHEDKIIDKNALIKKNKFFEIFYNEDKKIDIKILRNDFDFLNFIINTSRLHWTETHFKPFEPRVSALEKEYKVLKKDLDPRQEKDLELIQKIDLELKQKIDVIVEECKAYQLKYKNCINEPDLSNEQNYEQRLSLINKIYGYGFMLHRYKDASNAIAPFIMDNKVSETEKGANGGSGKSILFTDALEKALGFKNVEEIDGSAADVDKDKWLFENVRKATHVVVLSDIKSWFPMRILYNAITNGFQASVKHKSKFRMVQNESPKICVSTNFGLSDMEESSSSTRRLFVVPFSDFYHGKKTEYLYSWEPKQDFPKRFFQDWNDKDWNDFYNLNAQCIQFVMKAEEPVQAISKNIKKRNLQSIMGTDQFWFDQYFTIDKLNSFIPMNDIKDAYAKENKRPSSQSLNGKLKSWAEFRGHTFNPKEYQDSDTYIRRNIVGSTQTCMYIETTQSYIDQYEANKNDVDDNDPLGIEDPKKGGYGN